MPVTITVEPPRQPDIVGLLDASTGYARALYPPEHTFLLSIESLEAPAVHFYVARENGDAIGIAALVDLADGCAELKRMFVSAAARGRGVARALLRRIEEDAPAHGIRRIVLETGDLHDAALALYVSCGYQPIAQFGQYIGEPHSICFAKDLGVRPA